jgi:translation initiation factor 4A
LFLLKSLCIYIYNITMTTTNSTNTTNLTNSPDKVVAQPTTQVTDTNTETTMTIMEEWDDGDVLKSTVLRGIYAFGFEKPSPIQRKGIIPMLRETKGKRRDIIAQAQSGTGKTGCFTIAALNIVNVTKQYTQAIILAPTHELASQIFGVINSIGVFEKDLVTQLLVGGTSVDSDRHKLDMKPPHIVVGTPGRIHDMLRRGYLKTDHITLIVLDEADEMLSYGFKDQIYTIFQCMPSTIQIGLFSATIPEELESLTNKFMENPIQILVKADMLTLQGISQYYIRLDNDEQKYLTLKDIFGGLSISQSIIYCNSTNRVDDLYEAMVLDKFPVTRIHGKMDGFDRKENNKSFRNGQSRVLITSDLFARGIDVQQVSVVINFDVPKSEHTYLHRIGRSGRWGRKGVAINFVTKYDSSRLKSFEQYYNTEISEMPANWSEKLG